MFLVYILSLSLKVYIQKRKILIYYYFEENLVTEMLNQLRRNNYRGHNYKQVIIQMHPDFAKY